MRDDPYWNYRSESEKLGRRNAAEDAAARDNGALARLQVGQTVKTPDGWQGRIVEKIPERGSVYVETWETAGTYRASRVEPVGDFGGL